MEILASVPDFVAAGSSDWQQILKRSVKTSTELFRRLGLVSGDSGVGPGETGQTTGFPVFVPEPWLARIRPGNLNDPLLRQVLATHAENLVVDGFVADPLAESDSQPLPGLLHKYQGRVLLIVAGACAINCRYCFRRHFPYENAPKSQEQLESALQYVAQNAEIGEVILSGGDPLMLRDDRLKWIFERLSLISHVQRIRIHTRMPIVIPQRVTDGLLKLLANSRTATIMVVHSNHANELDDAVQSSLLNIRKESGTLLLNQSVLLRGVNDSVESLSNLSHRLIQCGVTPYYLHQLDPVAGAAHFLVPPAEGLEIVQAMQQTMSGYLVPRYVQELPGRAAKTPMEFAE